MGSVLQVFRWEDCIREDCTPGGDEEERGVELINRDDGIHNVHTTLVEVSTVLPERLGGIALTAVLFMARLRESI